MSDMDDFMKAQIEFRKMDAKDELDNILEWVYNIHNPSPRQKELIETIRESIRELDKITK